VLHFLLRRSFFDQPGVRQNIWKRWSRGWIQLEDFGDQRLELLSKFNSVAVLFLLVLFPKEIGAAICDVFIIVVQRVRRFEGILPRVYHKQCNAKWKEVRALSIINFFRQNFRCHVFSHSQFCQKSLVACCCLPCCGRSRAIVNETNVKLVVQQKARMLDATVRKALRMQIVYRPQHLLKVEAANSRI
jgi:hypothetical protein